MTVVGILPPKPEPVTREWTARTADHWYRVIARVESATCTEPPAEHRAEFAGRGELSVEEYRAGVDAHLATLGFTIVEVRLVETSEAQATVPPARPERFPPAATEAAPAAAPPDLTVDDFAPQRRLPAKPSRRGRRR